MSAPSGIEHLEDPALQDQLFSATGGLLDTEPGDAPMMLAGVLGDWMGGLVACGVLCSFRWWLGLLVGGCWVAARRSLSGLWSQWAAFRRLEAGMLRRAWYLLGLAWRGDAAKEMRVFGAGGWLVDGHRSLWFRAMESKWEALHTLERRAALAAVGVAAALGAAGAELAWAAYHGQIGLRELAILLPMLAMTAQLSSFSNGGQKAVAALRDVRALVDEIGASEDSRHRVGAVVGSSARRFESGDEIRFEGVRYRYPGSDADVLRGVDLAVPAGQATAIVGVNGAGKTTLVTLLAGLREPTGGVITYGGRPVIGVGVRSWQRHVAVVYQDFGHYPLSLRENVSLFDLEGGIDDTLLDDVAGRVGLLEVVSRLPRGWDTIVSRGFEGGVDLSGGQWQRVGLARALYAVGRGAGVLVLDEPTAHLDVRAEAAFYDRFFELTRDVTTIVISHRLPTVRKADQIAVLDGGRITELGTHDELAALGSRYAELIEEQRAQFSDLDD